MRDPENLQTLLDNGPIGPSFLASVRITKQLPHYAELSWRKDAAVDDILRFLAADGNLHITNFEVRRPTLNEIFLKLVQAPEGRHVPV